MQYDAVIRTRGYSEELENTLIGLKRQTSKPNKIVIVNSLDCEDAIRRLDDLGFTVVNYFEKPFNYSQALNIGVAEVEAEWVLIISSHIYIADPDMIETGVSRMGFLQARGVYWTAETVAGECIITRDNFTGRNGLYNACAFLKTSDVRDRPFDERLFSAEDQFWAKGHFEAGHSILRIETPAVLYANPHHTAKQPSLQKIANEDVAIAYFVKPRLSWPDHVALRFAKALIFTCLGRRDKAKVHWSVGVRLVRSWFRPPTADSDYLRRHW